MKFFKIFQIVFTGVLFLSLSGSYKIYAQTNPDHSDYEKYNLSDLYGPGRGDNSVVYLGESPMNEATVQVFPDGTIKIYHAPNRYSDKVMSMESTDGGLTWSQPEVIMEDSIIWQYPRRTLIDHEENLHLLVFREPDLAVFHTVTYDDGKTWKKLQKIADGRIGAIRGFIQTVNGRLIFGYQRRAWEPKPPYGSSYVSCVYSDDNGESWIESGAKIVAPVYENYIGSNNGAAEPNLVQLSDGRIYLLCRTQNGKLYQSFSKDEGETWSKGEPSVFYSSNSPANLLKFPDGRIAVTWCNTGDPDINTFGRVYTNRDVLHMAISDDDGKTWKGFREVFRIPTRNDQNDMPPRGDVGVAYPNTAFTKDGKIFLVTGQGEHGGGRAMFRISPEWLYETSQEDDFSDGLEKWSCYTFKKLSFKPGRILGPELLTDGDAKGGKVLHVRKARADLMGDGAVWNFPMGRKGELSMRVKVPHASSGTVISLTDHFRYPNDPDGERTAMFSVDSKAFGNSKWQTVVFKWDRDKKSCRLFVDNNLHSVLDMKNEPPTGISYLRYRSLAQEGSIDNEGIYIDWVNVSTSN